MLDRVVVLDPGAQVLEGCGCVPALVGSVHEVDGPDSRPQCVNFGSQSSGQGHGSISAQSSLTQNDKGRTRKSNPCLPHSGRGLRQWTRILRGSVSQGFVASTQGDSVLRVGIGVSVIHALGDGRWRPGMSGSDGARGADLWEVFSVVPDHRRAEGKRYPLAGLLMIALAAMLAGRSDQLGIVRWGRKLSREALAELGRNLDFCAVACLRLRCGASFSGRWMWARWNGSSGLG